MKKKLMTLAIAGALVFSAATSSKAVEFTAAGEWFYAFGVGDSSMDPDNAGDDFKAQQRLRMQIDAVASESLSGTISFEIGDQHWGKAEEGAQLGTDGIAVGIRDAYLDWIVPNAEVHFRMGLQGLAFPNAAGGAAILDDQVAAVAVNVPFNDMVGLTFAWARPFNDNFSIADGSASRYGDENNMFDNMDIFFLGLPLTFDGIEATPWVSYSAVGRNVAFENYDTTTGGTGNSTPDGISIGGLVPFNYAGQSLNWNDGYGTLWYAGLPVVISAADPWNFEFDLNYGSFYGYNDYLVGTTLADSDRSGWVIKALAEYNMDWGVPGIFAWYGSGDDDDAYNGSERMPVISPSANFTSFIQDGPNGYSIDGGYDLELSYSGSWGIGVQIRDMSFVEDLSHTLRVTYWGGTNDTAMASHVGAWKGDDGFYLTTDDSLVEINFDSTYQIYENLSAVVELGYIYNGVDDKTWNTNEDDLENGWKAALMMMYSF